MVRGPGLRATPPPAYVRMPSFAHAPERQLTKQPIQPINQLIQPTNQPTQKTCRAPVSALGSAFQSRRGAWCEDLGCEIVSCDEGGGITVWAAHSAAVLDRQLDVEAGGGVGCCGVAVRKGLIVVARVDGAVRIYGLVS